MTYVGKRIRIFDSAGTQSVPALLILMDDGAIVIEAHPSDVGRRSPLNGQSRAYPLAAGVKFEEIDEFKISEDLAQHAREFVEALHAFHAAASPLGFLEGLV